MSNRGYSLLLLFLALAGHASKVSAQTAALQVLVYDYAGLKPAALNEFIGRTLAILVGAGVAVEVDACPRCVAPSCDSQAGIGRRVFIRLVAGTAKSMKNARRPPLGQSFADHEGGTYASVFLAPVQDQADEANVPWVTVLAYAAAHEIGHLLLGDQAHTPRGLMKANWDRKDFQAMNQNNFHFCDEQTRQLASRYGATHPAETSLDMAQVRP